MRTVITSKTLERNHLARMVVDFFVEAAKKYDWGDNDAVLYYGFPKFHGYEDHTPCPDLLFLSKRHGMLALRLVDENCEDGDELENALDEIHSLIFTKLFESRLLRSGKRRSKEIKLPLEAYAFWNNDVVGESFQDILLTCNDDIEQTLAEMEAASSTLDEMEFNECRSIIEGTKALSAHTKREVALSDTTSKSYILSVLEDEIKNFDFEQRASAVSIIDGPQRIRGLAGSGKTVVLAMKAAHLHLTEPDKKILFTFYTKSLYGHVKNLITRFYRHYKKVDPNWDNLHIKHAWGGSGVDGVYFSACMANGIKPMKFADARARAANPFDFVCQDALRSSEKIRPAYHYVLMDEAQDMPAHFFRLVYRLTLGERDFKNIIWGYDELQNIFKVKTRSPKELFGQDSDGVDLIDLDRSSQNLPSYLENDIVLKKCYRNPRDILITAHALGFGLYSKDGQHVQSLEDKEHWQDLGYEALSDDFSIGAAITIQRPEKNSPLSILNHESQSELIKYKSLEDMTKESEWIAEQIYEFCGQGHLKPEDILVISLDDRRARQYFEILTQQLSTKGIRSNNVLLNPYNSKKYLEEGMVTLSTIHRAKGNEAPAVFVMGIDALYFDRKSRFARNKIFTAFTRAKAWLRVSGWGTHADAFFAEMQQAIDSSPNLVFNQPDPAYIETIQRDLSDKKKSLKQLREEMSSQLDLINLSEEEKSAFFRGEL